MWELAWNLRDTYKILRPLILGSIKILFILVKVGFHVAAGIGNAIPDFQMLSGVEPISALALTGETVMDSIKWISSIPIDSTLADAWAWIQVRKSNPASSSRYLLQFD